MVAIYVATVQSGFTNFQLAKLPTEAMLSKTFTVMDTSEQTVFLHIQNRGINTPMGNVYISDGTGKYYSLSMSDVIKGAEYIDFEKVNSLTGVFLTNKYDVSHQRYSGKSSNGGDNDDWEDELL